MPNHVANSLSLSMGLDNYIEVVDGSLTFDFNKVIPMPPLISRGNIRSRVKLAAKIALGLVDFSAEMPVDPLGSQQAVALTTGALLASNAQARLASGDMAKDLSDGDFDEFVRMMRAYRKYGYLDWYDWSVANWGTKWNSYDVSASGTEVRFHTAWSAPHPVVSRIAEVNRCTLMHKWADEDIGRNVGWRLLDDNGRILERELSGTKEGYELAFELNHGVSDDYKLTADGSTYEYDGERAQ